MTVKVVQKTNQTRLIHRSGSLKKGVNSKAGLDGDSFSTKETGYIVGLGGDRSEH